MFEIEKSVLVVIDVQGKLAEIVHDKDRVYQNIQALIKAAKILNIPILWTEQLPDKIGKTISPIAELLTGDTPIIKSSFSCCGCSEFQQKLKKLQRSQVIIVGIEAHVCVLQTVADLLKNKYQVQVVVDAISARSKDNKDIAMLRAGQIGAFFASTEMVMTELLKTAEHPRFKEILGLMK